MAFSASDKFHLKHSENFPFLVFNFHVKNLSGDLSVFSTLHYLFIPTQCESVVCICKQLSLS